MTPLVLVHGFMGGGAQWELQIEGLGATRDIIAVDLPGFGANASMAPLGSIADYADWVAGYLSDKGVSRFHLLGHSMGGMVVQEMAIRHGDRIERLVLYATGSIGVLPGRFETIDVSKQRAVRDGATATARRIAATWFLETDTASEYAPCVQIAAQTKLPAILAGLDAMQAWSGNEKLERIGMETLVIWGDGDRTYPWEQIQQLWKKIPRSTLAVVPGCAHAVHSEKPKIFNTILDDFLGP